MQQIDLIDIDNKQQTSEIYIYHKYNGKTQTQVF